MTIDRKRRKQLLAVFLVLVPIMTFLQFGHLLSIHNLKTNRDWIASYVDSNFFFSSVIFIAVLTLDIALTIPGATTLSFAGGLFFKQPFAAIYAYIGYVLGAWSSYWLVRTVLAEYVRPMLRPNSSAFKKFEAKLKENGFLYVIIARYTLIFPYWFVTASASIVGVPFITFAPATSIASIPGAIIYTTAGVALSTILEKLDSRDISNMSPGDLILRTLAESNDVKLLAVALAIAGLIPISLKVLFSQKHRQQKTH